MVPEKPIPPKIVVFPEGTNPDKSDCLAQSLSAIFFSLLAIEAIVFWIVT